jgi:UDP-N-acetylmuramyl pentapeptide synthase
VTAWTAARVRGALGLPWRDEQAVTFTRVLTDTRSIVRGALFVALARGRFDGHDPL